MVGTAGRDARRGDGGSSHFHGGDQRVDGLGTIGFGRAGSVLVSMKRIEQRLCRAKCEQFGDRIVVAGAGEGRLGV